MFQKLVGSYLFQKYFVKTIIIIVVLLVVGVVVGVVVVVVDIVWEYYLRKAQFSPLLEMASAFSIRVLFSPRFYI